MRWRRWLALGLVWALAGCGAAEGRPAPSQGFDQSPGMAIPSPTTAPGGSLANWVVEENAKPGDSGWQVDRDAGPDDLAGFADRESAAPGEQVMLRITSTAANFDVRAYRLGFYGGKGARLLWTSAATPAVKQQACDLLAGNMVSCANWKPSMSVDTTGWPAGSYLFKLQDNLGRGSYIPLTIRSTDFSGKVLFVSATNTYQAYNGWGGYSLYRGKQGPESRASRVSFDRPYDHGGARFVVGYEYGIFSLAERLGINLAYGTSRDLEAGGEAFAGLRGLLSPGHDEYWSVPMRDTVEHLRDTGTNLAFLGANSVYWRIRREASPLGKDRIVVCFKSAGADPVKGPTTTTKWRSQPASRPESYLVGMLYECFPVEGAFRVEDPNFFLFAGTGAKRGSTYPGLIGVEIDRAYPGALAPKNLQIVGHSPVTCGKNPTFSDMTYYTVPSGAGVFASGTMNWRYGLDGAPQPGTGLTLVSLAFANKVTSNLLLAMAAGPMGDAHPANSNLAAIAPSASTGAGTGGSVG